MLEEQLGVENNIDLELDEYIKFGENIYHHWDAMVKEGGDTSPRFMH